VSEREAFLAGEGECEREGAKPPLINFYPLSNNRIIIQQYRILFERGQGDSK
jgi:hypothetical protein